MLNHFTQIPNSFKSYTLSQLISISGNEKYFCLLNSNSPENNFLKHHFEFVAAFGCVKYYNVSCIDDLIKNKKNEFLFGHVSFDYKNEIFHLKSKKKPEIAFETIHFFVPELIVCSSNGSLYYHIHENSKRSIEEILNQKPKTYKLNEEENIAEQFDNSLSFSEYQKSFKKIKRHIKRGDIYEINFCIEFKGTKKLIPEKLYNQLNKISFAPYSALYKTNINWLICSSPELYLQYNKGKVISRPIKGTINRGNNEKEDHLLKQKLQNSLKEQTENVMIVDLVRNDLSVLAARNSVSVNKFLQIESYRQVHQMVSEVSCRLNKKYHPLKLLDTTFPMGSMTGVPKKRALEIAEETENFCRGIYSGTLGMITPENDFIFNVIIRSIAYNEVSHRFSFGVGSAITWHSKPKSEYDECLLKAAALKKVLKL